MKQSCQSCGRVIRKVPASARGKSIRCVCGGKFAEGTRRTGLASSICLTHGPGAELTALFAELDITERPGCNCKAIAAEMDRAGPAGCRERLDYFLSKLHENARRYDWWEKLWAGTAAWNRSLPLTLGGMFDEAVRRAESKVRVAFLTPSLLMGGAERWIASLVRHFDRSKIVPVGIFVSGAKQPSPIVLSWLPKKFPVVEANRIGDQAAAFDCLISWGHADLARFVGGIDRPIIDAQHGTMGFGPAQRAIADGAIAAGAYLAAVGAACLDTFDADVRPRVRVIENGAETDRLFSPIGGGLALREKLAIPDDAKVLLYIGRFAREKNLDGLAAAVEVLPREWILVAAGPQYSVPPRLTALGDRLRLLDAQEHLGDLFAAGDVFCAPSHHEANSLAVIEAMLAGIPVVTTDYPAIRLLDDRHGSLGWRVPLQPSPDVLAGAIQLAHQSGRSSQRTEHARAVAWEHYTAEAMARRWESYIQEVRDDYHSRRVAPAPALRHAS